MVLSVKEYHRQTSYSRSHRIGHPMDWANQPSVYKEYPNVESISLSCEVPTIEDNLSQISAKTQAGSENFSFSAETLSCILLNSYRITGKTRYQGQDFFYRSVPSAGALYPFELYAAVNSVSGLEHGLYHYDIRQHEMKKIRTRNFFKDKAAITFFITAIFFRSTWKYRDRAYRYHLLDAGHLTENLALTLKALSIPFEITCDFADSEINSFLGLDQHREVCLVMIQIPDNQFNIRNAETLPETFMQASRVADKEVSYPLIEQIHAAGSMITLQKQADEMLLHIGLSPASWSEIPKIYQYPEMINYSETVRLRRSSRNYIRTELPENNLNFLLNLLCCDAPEPETLSITFLANRINGMTSGYYLLDQTKHSIALIRDGSLNELMAHICLDQQWLANASLHVCFAANLDHLDKLWGARGYRYAMINAGRLAQRLYLGATAMGLGACGVGAFYDDETSEILEINDESVMMYLMAIGTVKRLK